MRTPILVYLALTATLFSTSCKPEEEKIAPPDSIHILVDSNSLVLHQDIDSNIAGITFIPLQSTKDAIIGNIQKIAFTDRKIVLLEKDGQNAIYIFNDDGSLFKVLRSPGGNHISDFIVQDHRILLFLNIKKTIEFFNEAGEHVRTEQTNPDLLANSFEHMHNQTYAFWNNTTLTKVGNYRLLTFDNYNEFRMGFLPFSYETAKNIASFNEAPFNRLSNGVLYVSQPLNDTIWGLDTKEDHMQFYPGYVLEFQKKPLPPNFVNQPSNYNMFKAADDSNHSYYLKNFMDLDSLVAFKYVSGHSHYNFLWNKRSKKSMANAEELGVSKWDLTLPGNMQQVGKNTAVGYYHAYELTAWAKSHKNLKTAASLLAICSHLSDLDNPVLISIEYK